MPGMREHTALRFLDGLRFGPMHRRVWWLSAMGIMLDGFDFFIIGVAVPLIVAQWSITPFETGLLTSAAVLGAIVGAAVMGPLSDRIGRKIAFRIDLGMFVVFSLASAFAPDIWWLIAFAHGDYLEENKARMANNTFTPCILANENFASAFLFSVETQHTIGYGSRQTTEECPDAIIMQCIQSIVGVIIQVRIVHPQLKCSLSST